MSPAISFAHLVSERHIMNKTFATLSTALVAAAMISLTALPASAHHSTITGEASCNTATGVFDIVWTVENWNERTPGTVLSSTNNLLPAGDVIATSKQYTQTGALQGTNSLQVRMGWYGGDRNQRTDSGSVEVVGECSKPIPEKPVPVEVVQETVGEFVCGDTTVTVTTRTNFFGHTLIDNVWVVDAEPSESSSSEVVRDLTAAEIESLDCAVTPPVETPVGPSTPVQLPTVPVSAELARTGSSPVIPAGVAALLLAVGGFLIRKAVTA